MKRRLQALVLIVLVLLCSCGAPLPKDQAVSSDTDYQVLVYYFPQYHRDPRNDVWNGPGWTEWDLVAAARPRYPGHRQPITPAWGPFDESDPAWSAREIDLAADHGITGFIYDWYWYDDAPFLEGALERGFLQASNRGQLDFALMWANHDWVNLYPAEPQAQQRLLTPGATSATSFDRLVDYVIAHYFNQPNYLRIDGAPYFSIYDIATLIDGLGGVRETHVALERFRAKTKAAGFPDLHLNFVVWSFNVLPTSAIDGDPLQLLSQLGGASGTSYAWVHHYDLNSSSFPHGSYLSAAEANYAAWADIADRLDVPYFPNVSMGWDPSPRTRQDLPYAPHGYPWTAVLANNTPANFERALQRAKAFVDERNTRPKIVVLNAWNEWTEGSYLLPDTEHGTAYLEAVRAVFATPKSEGTQP